MKTATPARRGASFPSVLSAEKLAVQPVLASLQRGATLIVIATVQI
jgi:hypothetical protein